MYARYYILILLFCSGASISAQNGLTQENLSSFVECGASAHAGDHTPLWQVSNQHGLSSLDNNSYLRGGVFYKDTLSVWKIAAGLDMAVASGFTSSIILQQSYADIGYKCISLSIGSKEIDSPLLNQQLSSGGLTWSGNARPIPQVWIGLPEYIQVLPRLALKAELSYGWFTDNNYQKKQVGKGYWFTKDIKYHHKSAFLRIGVPQGKWQLDLGLSIDTQFGGYKSAGMDAGDLGNSWKDYFKILIPSRGSNDGPNGERAAFQGNYMGSEHIRITYRYPDFTLSGYLENYYDDFTGMGKFNGLDGLWGIEYKSNHSQVINGFVLEYYQTTNQSGPMHGLDNSVVNKTGGADNYYNNDWYPGWVHWGMTMANPLITSPIYNKNGDMTFKYNRIRALHLGWSGDINREWTYIAKLSYNKTWGTPFKPMPDILENFSTFVSFYYLPRKWEGWQFSISVASDVGEIYGDNVGCQLKVHKKF